jgi:Cysteine-rich CPCC
MWNNSHAYRDAVGKVNLYPIFPCPCCGYFVYNEKPGSYDLCPICLWEDDLSQFVFPDQGGGPNEVSLINGQRNFQKVGCCLYRIRQNVRAVMPEDKRDPTWRMLIPKQDRYLKWACEADHELWQNLPASRYDYCFYYWREEYWLNTYPR